MGAFNTANGVISRIILKILNAGDSPETGNRLFVPSLTLVLVISSSILISYSRFLCGPGRVPGLALLALSLITLPLVYYNSMKMATPPGGPTHGRSMARCAGLLVLSAVLAALVYIRVHDLCAPFSLPAKDSVITARVEGVVTRRYTQEVTITIGASTRAPRLKEGDDSRSGGIAYISPDVPVRPGDVVIFSYRPAPGGVLGRYPARLLSFYQRGITHIFYPDASAVVAEHAGMSAREWIREWIGSRCDGLFDRDTAAIVRALFFGNSAPVDKRTLNDYRRSGLIHVISASGLHVGIVAAIPLFILGMFRVNRKSALCAAALVIGFYLYITDMPVSLIRACIMFWLFAVQYMMDRKGNVVNTLFLSAVVILCLFPYDLYDLGFQLSFGATLGIVLFHRTYQKTLSYLPRPVSSSLALTISAQVLVIPVIFLRLGEVNCAGILANLLVVPAMSLLLVVAIAATAISVVTTWASLAGLVGNLLNKGILHAVALLSALDGHFYPDRFGPALMIAFALLIFPLFPRLRGRRILSLATAVAICLSWGYLGAERARSGSTRAIRHGRGTFIVAREGDVVYVAGSLPARDTTGAISREIMKMGGRMIDLCVTETGYAGMAGFASLARTLPVRRCYLSDTFRVRGYTRRFFRLLEQDGVSLSIHDFSSPINAAPDRVDRLPRGAARASCLYRQVCAGTIPVPAAPYGKNECIRYLTLHKR